MKNRKLPKGVLNIGTPDLVTAITQAMLPPNLRSPNPAAAGQELPYAKPVSSGEIMSADWSIEFDDDGNACIQNG